ncbi:MAG: hypothetical protein HYI21_15670 [Sediminibacterium sp. Gen4]|jgi:hypothetical protein|uniref:hypothetical protein n=1 Tax=unclassified Sediminibacterium TaxID=2635961 RepID=UPI0015BD52D8|nr:MULTISPECIES: hypothetical protein [unclassified Sediminibacterium]MBW0160989.1 hypothetical protein [Sediminibacterium sp.]MBW0164479.1 hypothetical protein [Sediminibacterium sp.]NWK67464.1 hypothetical protein [Sediminibacterium sp. Gen4]
MKKTMMALIAFTLITGITMASDNKNNKKAETKKATKEVCNKKDCKGKKDCTKSCTPPGCTKKC